MTVTPHDVTTEFPGEEDRIHALREGNGHFARLVEEYDEVNRAIYAAETRIEPTDEAHEDQMRRRRLALKDEIRMMLESA